MKTLRQNPNVVNHTMLSSGSGRSDIATHVSAMPDWPRIIHGRRRPIGKYVNRSMNGAATILKLKGMKMMAV